jgi:hypothetical protein
MELGTIAKQSNSSKQAARFEKMPREGWLSRVGREAAAKHG